MVQGTNSPSSVTEPSVAIETPSGIDPELEQRVKKQATAFRSAYRRTVEEAWTLGQELCRAKQQVRHGQWIPWVEGTIGLTRRTAQRFMALHQTYPEKRHVTLLDSTSQALRALPSDRKSKSSDSPAESESDSGVEAASMSEGRMSPTGGAANTHVGGGIVTAARELSRVIERLDPILHEEPTSATVHHGFPALCEALQTITSAIIGYADTITTASGADGPSPKELTSALEAALAKVRQVKDSILAQAPHGG